MARQEEDTHWLLRRQLHEQKATDDASSFVQAVNKAYRIFDDNYLRLKLILRRKIYQLVESNAELQRLVNEKSKQVDTTTADQLRLINNLKRAEVLANLGSFNWNLKERYIDLSDNLRRLLSIEDTTSNALSFIRKFDSPERIIRAFRHAYPLKNMISIENLRLGNEERYFDLEAELTFNGKEELMAISGILKENTKFVHASARVDDQKKFYEAILNNIPVEIAIFNEDHQYLYINPVAVQQHEVRDFLLGRDDFDYCRFKNLDTSIAEVRRRYFNLAKSSLKSVEFEDDVLSYDSEHIYKLRRFFPVVNAQGKFAFMIGYGIDITKMKAQELSLEHSLHEKEALLGEVHHSVKNNLTLIVALLEINTAHEKDELVKKYFNEIRNRISAMALIYDKLYRSEVFNRINLKDYLNALVRSLQQSYLQGRKDLLELNLEEIYVDNKSAVPLALLVNELVSNAFVHAFPHRSFPRMELSLKNTPDGVLLVVADNGPGLPEDVDLARGKTFGFKLIGLFVRQLKGKLTYQSSKGLRIEVLFQNIEIGR